jgi:hypothetical protein
MHCSCMHAGIMYNSTNEATHATVVYIILHLYIENSLHTINSYTATCSRRITISAHKSAFGEAVHSCVYVIGV